MTEVGIKTGAMTPEEQQVGEDLVHHAIERIKVIIKDFVELHDHPAQLYMLTNNGLHLFMHGMSRFDVRMKDGSNVMDRILHGTMIALVMTLANRGQPDCQALMESGNLDEIDWRSLARTIAKIKTSDGDSPW